MHKDVHVKLLFGKKLLFTVFAGMVISALVFLLAKTQLLLVLELSSTGLTAEVCLTCVCRHVVPEKSQ